MRQPKLKDVYESPAPDKQPFVMNADYDWPEHCCFYNEKGHAVPYPETLQSYVMPLIKSAGLGEDGLSFEREYIVTSKKRSLAYRCAYNFLLFLGDMPMMHFYNGLSFGAHYRITDDNDFPVFHASILYSDGPYGEIEFNVEYRQARVLHHRYGFRAFDTNRFVYDLDYDVINAIAEIFTVLETRKVNYQPSSVFFDIDSYMQIPRFMRPRGSFQIPLFPGSNGLASRKVHHLLNKMNWLCADYEYNKYKKIKSDKTR